MEFDIAKIEQAFRVKPELFPDEGLVKVSFPRTEVKVVIDNKAMKPFMGLTSWVSFQKGSKKGIEVMIMGDLCLFEDEVNPSMSIALENSIDVTALHNHFFFDDPKVYFMHIGGEGQLEKVALGIRAILDSVKEIRMRSRQPLKDFGGQESDAENTIDGGSLEEILGSSGQARDGMFKIVIGRQTRAECGCIVGKNMGVNTWAAFSGSNERALVCGDFALLERELQQVLKTLRGGGINVVAIHNHMTLEQPRFVFIHYWGKGRSTDLATALRSALDKTSGTGLTDDVGIPLIHERSDSHCEHCGNEEED